MAGVVKSLMICLMCYKR